jgi:hypothetical protein
MDKDSLFFALMGGFCIIGHDGKRRPLPLHDMEEYLPKKTHHDHQARDRRQEQGRHIVERDCVHSASDNTICTADCKEVRTPTELVTVAFATLNFLTLVEQTP